MLCKRFKPDIKLIEYIKEYMIIDLTFDDKTFVPPPKAYPVNPEEGIRFILRGQLWSQDAETNIVEERAPVTVFGQPNRRQNLIITNNFTIFHVRFQPGGLFKLLKIPMTEMLHKNYEAELVMGKEINEIQEQLLYSSGYEQMIAVIDKYFQKKIGQLKPLGRPIDKIGRHILENPQLFNLAKVAQQACLSHRQFEKRFEQLVGVTPKYYARICRFYQAYVMKEFNPELDWLSIAIQNGYSDYQHLVKDFKHFAGTTPNILIKESLNNPERAFNTFHDFRGV
ncbi:AraC family transcriptional regulator [Chitinophaga silvatica]|uniref:AraC family transcriptional regulator n=1 Tax=Chitinophaga silvatica TaxID=2282649 RepID=A0A3E1YHU5_9BACT|nr:AraC family transcriptional regulator [Chitinophaga silvatica]RFS26914.1 AraC family transcriptional regulator [Chitinophaga silvatica]